MKPWSERPGELANLLNPAFCGALIRNFAAGYQSAAEQAIEFELLIVALPLVLHRPTQQTIPRTIATKFSVWIDAHAHLRVGFADRCRAVIPFAREGLAFAVQHKLVHVTNDSRVESKKKAKLTPTAIQSIETIQIIDTAHFVGRWLVGAGGVAQVFSALGVRP